MIGRPHVSSAAALVLIVDVSLFVLLCGQWMQEPRGLGTGHPHRRQSSISFAVPARPNAPSQADIADAVARPLFVEGRRPPPPPAPPKAVVEEDVVRLPRLDRYSVVGIIVAPRNASAVLKNQTGGSVRLHVGDQVEGWTVTAIEPRRIRLLGQGEESVLELITRSVSAATRTQLHGGSAPP